MGGEPGFDVVGGVLHNDDGVVHHDADGQDQGEQGHEVDGEAQERNRGKRADNGHRHGGGGHQGGAPVLQEHHDNDEHQDTRFIEGVVHRVDGILNKNRGVVIDGILQARWKILAHLFHGLAHLRADIHRIGVRQGIDNQVGGLLAGQHGKVGEGLLGELHPGQVPHPDDLGGLGFLGPHRLDNDVFKLGGAFEPSQGVDGELKSLAGGHRRPPQLPGHHLDVLLLDRVHHVHGGEPVILELVGVQPHAHGVRAGADDVDLGDPGQPGQGVLQVDHAVIGQVGFIKAVVVRIEAHHLQDIGGDLLDIHPLGLHGLRAAGPWRR